MATYRRRFLCLCGVVGIGALAGCSDNGNLAEEKTTAPPSTETATPDPTPTPTETDTPTETEEETETPDSTETPEKPNPGLESIAADVAASIDAYTDSQSDTTEFSDIWPTTYINPSDTRNPLYDARDRRDGIDRSELPSDEQTRYDQLEGGYWFAWWLTPTHNGVYNGYKTLRSGWNDILDRNWEGAIAHWEDISGGTTNAEENLDRLKKDSESSDMDGFERLSPEDYTAKVDQLKTALADTNSLGEPMLTIADGFKHYDSGGDNDYLNAEQEFSDAVETLEDRDWSAMYNSFVDDATCVADAMASGCELLDRAQQTNDKDRKQTFRENAQEEFDKCEIVDNDINIKIT